MAAWRPWVQTAWELRAASCWAGLGETTSPDRYRAARLSCADSHSRSDCCRLRVAPSSPGHRSTPGPSTLLRHASIPSSRAAVAAVLDPAVPSELAPRRAQSAAESREPVLRPLLRRQVAAILGNGGGWCELSWRSIFTYFFGGVNRYPAPGA